MLKLSQTQENRRRFKKNNLNFNPQDSSIHGVLSLIWFINGDDFALWLQVVTLIMCVGYFIIMCIWWIMDEPIFRWDKENNKYILNNKIPSNC